MGNSDLEPLLFLAMVAVGFLALAYGLSKLRKNREHLASGETEESEWLHPKFKGMRGAGFELWRALPQNGDRSNDLYTIQDSKRDIICQEENTYSARKKKYVDTNGDQYELLIEAAYSALGGLKREPPPGIRCLLNSRQFAEGALQDYDISKVFSEDQYTYEMNVDNRNFKITEGTVHLNGQKVGAYTWARGWTDKRLFAFHKDLSRSDRILLFAISNIRVSSTDV